MAGTLTISTLSDGTNSTSSTNCIQGSAKAWVRFNGTTSPGTINASYNVTSVTKNGTGDYTVNFTNALSDANYSAAVAAGDATASGKFAFGYWTAAPTTSAFRMGTSAFGGSQQDQPYISAVFFR